MKTRIAPWVALAAALVLTACTSTAPPPAITPQGDDRYLPDPRLGWRGTATPAVARRFDEAYRHLLAGDYTTAQKRLTDLRAKNPEYTPATLADALIAIRQSRLDDAHAIATRVLDDNADYTAARVYLAEIAVRRNETRAARDLYRAVAQLPDAPSTAQERVTALDTALFNELLASAQTASDAEAVRVLREALAINAGASNARILLVQKLIAGRSYDEARRELDPILNSNEVDRPEVQEALAEIDAGRGRYQEAIVRYDRLARRTKDDRYARLEAIKVQWSAANQPAHVRRAMTTEAVTRADFATLLYWNVNSVRFAQNLATPQIAIDIAEVEGREELVRAIALGIYDVDPVTRRVSPYRQITAGNLPRLTARVLSMRGATCARGQADSAKVLAACSITDLPAGDPEAFVTGQTALRVLEQVDRALK